MFDPALLAKIAKVTRPTFEQLIRIEKNLNTRFVGLKDPVRALILAVACGEPLLLIGPPGPAKSRLIRSSCAMVGLIH